MLGENTLYLGHPDRVDPELLEDIHQVRQTAFPIGYPG
jgi:hypothetical protein